MTMKRNEITNCNVEEFIPLVVKLAEKYTSKESSSISYHTANVLMEAVIYCVSHGEGDAMNAYESGYKVVMEKVMECRDLYDALFEVFDSYENKVYFDTVIHGMPGFFQKYDPKFQPQYAILTFDYPTLTDVSKLEGVDAVYAYLEAVRLEQIFLGRIPRQLLMDLYYRYHWDYKNLVINLVSIPLRHILGSMMIGKKDILFSMGEDEQERLKKYLKNYDNQSLEKTILKLITSLVNQFYEKDQNLIGYLSQDTHDFAVSLSNAAQYNSLKSIFP